MKTIKIQNNKPVCSDFWGQSAVFHCFADMPDENNRQYSAKWADLEAERAGKMGIKIARSDYACWAWDETSQEYNWETPACQALYRWLERLQKQNITVALNPWCCGAEVMGTGFNGPHPWAVPGNWEKSLQGFADYISESVHQIIEVRGFKNFKILTLFTEPQNSRTPNCFPKRSDGTEAGIYEVYRDIAIAVDAALRRDGRRHLISIMGPNEGSTTTSYMVKWMAENMPKGVLDIYSSHNYQWNPEFLKDSGVPYTTGATTSIPGGRIFRKVALTPNTEYEISVRACVECNDLLHLSGCVLLGAFSADDLPNAGGQPTNRLNRHSVTFLDASKLENSFTDYTVRFQSEEATEANICIFCDLSALAYNLHISSFGLKNCATGETVFQSGDIAKEKALFSCYAMEICSSDVADDWQNWVHTALNFLPAGTPYIYDEYNVGFNKEHSRDAHGANLATATISIMNAGATSSMLWTLFDQQWPNNHTTNPDCFVDGDHRWGISPNYHRSLVPHKSYYAFSMISRYTGGTNSKVFAGLGQDGLNATMNEMADGNLTVVVVNNRNTACDFTLNFEKALGVTLHRHRFDPATIVPDETASIIPADTDFEQVGNILQDCIAPYSVTVYTTIE